MYIRPQIEQHLYIMHVDKMNLSRYTSSRQKTHIVMINRFSF